LRLRGGQLYRWLRNGGGDRADVVCNWHKRRHTLGIASGLLNLLPFLGLILSLALPLAAAMLQFGTPGRNIHHSYDPFLHVVSAICLFRIYCHRVSIGRGGDIGILFWLAVGCDGLAAGCAAEALVKLLADLHPSLCHVSNMLA